MARAIKIPNPKTNGTGLRFIKEESAALFFSSPIWLPPLPKKKIKTNPNQSLFLYTTASPPTLKEDSNARW